MVFRAGDVSRRTILVAVVLAGILLGGGIVAADGAFAAGDDRVDSDNGSATEVGSNPAADVEIDQALQESDGEVEAIVRFESADLASVKASSNAVETLKTKASASQAPLKRYAAGTDGVTVENDFWITNAALVTVDTEQVALEELARIDGVAGIQPNYEVQAAVTQSTGLSGSNKTGPANRPNSTSPVNASTSVNLSASGNPTYGLEQISVPEAWDEFGTKGGGATVAVLDTGIDTENHNDLDLIDDGWKDFINHQSSPYDDNGHGTHVSGTVGGDTTAYNEQYGVAPDVRLLHGKVLASDGSGSTSGILEAMEWAADHPADVDVISMSLGGNRYDDSYVKAVRNANANGVAVIAAVGNDGEGTSGSPANTNESLAVGGTDWNADMYTNSSGEVVYRHYFDSYGSGDPNSWIVPDVTAPGVGVFSSIPGGNYDYFTGTSMATPHVSGVAALMESATKEDLTPTEIQNALTETAWKPAGEPPEQDTRYGHGIVNATAAIQEVTSGRVEGTISDNKTGEHIEGATVAIEAVNDDWSTTAETNPDGTYVVENVPAIRNYTVIASADGYEENSAEVSPRGMETVTADVSLDGNASVSGTLTDATEVSQAALPNASAEIAVTYENGSSFSVSTEADGDGAFELDGVKGGSQINLTVDVPGYETNTTESIDMPNPGVKDLGTIQLTGNATLSGTMTDGDGTPLPEETVTAETGSRTYESRSTSDGSYAISLPGTRATYNVSVDAEGFAPWNESLTIDGDHTQNIELEATTVLTGTVTDYETETGLAGIEVAVEDAGETVATAATAADGAYSVGLPQNGTYNVSIDASGYDSWERTDLTVDGEYSLNASLSGDANVTLDVGDQISGAPIENATVALENETVGTYNASTNATGVVTVENVSSAYNYTVSVDATGYEANVSTLEDLSAGDNPQGTVTLRGDAVVEGTITDEAATEPLPNATVTVTYPDGTTAVGSAETPDNGTFRIEGVPGNGSTYGVSVTADGYEPLTDTSVQANESEIVSFDRTLAGNATITGTVTDAHSGEGLVGAPVTVTYPDGETAIVGTETVGGDEKATTAGEFTVANVPGTGANYSVSVNATGYDAATNDSVAVASNTTATVDFAPTGAATIRGAVVDSVSGHHLANATLTVDYPDGGTTLGPNETSDGGRFAIADVPATGAEYTLNASAAGYEEYRTNLTVELGYNESIAVEMVGNASISGTVNSTAGALLENVSISAETTAGASYPAETDANGTYTVENVAGTGANHTVAFDHPIFRDATQNVSELTDDVGDVNATLTQKARYFGVRDFTAPDSATVDSGLDVSATIPNRGTDDWNDSVRLLVNGTETGTQNVSLNATDDWRTDENATITFTHTPATTGEANYTVATANASASTNVTVEESSGGGLPPAPPSSSGSEASLYLVDTTLDTDELAVGETGSVTATVSNTGDAEGEGEFELTHDGSVLDTVSVTVPAGERVDATLQFTFDDPGEYDLAVDGGTIGGEGVGTVTVTEASAEPVGETDGNESASTDDVDTPDGGDSILGFTPVAALVALAVTVVLTRRQ
ncbi:carboxypeptidase regulatory-like domain-containing protein [Halovivax cerinus]|uniref:Carboxypeptidase regulatory-like domain-containing protein n=1 Tax=Halovivax cerinus TaxID=1487865 RepID=A0ABD5NPG7_9EURY|nr:carboxypeptidase regulatory-like domain-containing protein [Halovivax cerinus]